MSKRILRVSVALTTRNRDDHALACVKTILANEGFDPLFVIDQSDGDQTETAMATLDDARLRFMPTRRVTPRDSVRCDASFSPGQKVALADDSPN
jgi:hypothetical protein